MTGRVPTHCPHKHCPRHARRNRHKKQQCRAIAQTNKTGSRRTQERADRKARRKNEPASNSAHEQAIHPASQLTSKPSNTRTPTNTNTTQTKENETNKNKHEKRTNRANNEQASRQASKRGPEQRQANPANVLQIAGPGGYRGFQNITS